MGTQQEKIMGLEGFFMGSIMADEISEHSSAFHKNSCKILGVPICQENGCYGFVTFYFIFEHTITFCWV
jgi:hypothetical protein